MKARARLEIALCVLAAACTNGQSHPTDTGGAQELDGGTADATGPPSLDPGPPALFFGPRCTAEVTGISLPPACVSAVVEERQGLTHLFLNFCVSNGVDHCQSPPPIYLSLLLPSPGWVEGTHQMAVGGRVELSLPDGRRFRLGDGRGPVAPFLLRVQRQPNGPDGFTLFGELVVDVPRVDAAGDPITLRARIN
jgi:hypothetical protein